MMFRQIIVSLTLVAFSCGFFSGCATTGSGRSPADGETQKFDPESPLVKLKEVESFRVTDPDGPKVVDEELEQIPTEINPLVEKWVAYFQGKGRPHMERYLARSTRYMKLMKKILRQNGLPEDLVYIALIESGFTSKATSRAAAVGFWQFIRGTGRRYGLEVNALVDERRDPIMSTQAAAEYFKGLYSVFGSWYLAMASYNVGENRVKREVMNHYTRDFWELARKNRFPKETVNYIPKFIAAKLIGNNPEKYGFTEIEYMTPIEFDHVTLTKPVNLKIMATKMGIEYDDLKQLNPKFKGEIAPLDKNSLELRVPVGQSQQAAVAAQQAIVDKVEYVADAGETEIYKVRSGDSLYTIARKYRTTVVWLKDVNDLKNGKKLRVGQRLAVPDRAGRKTAAKLVAKASKVKANKEDVEKAAANPELVTAKGVFYIVQPGDTLSAIADDYNSSIEELRRMNKMSRGSVLKAGLKLRVPKDDGLPQEAPESGKVLVSSQENTQGSRMADREPQSVGSAHVVRNGENLTTIAKKYGVSLGALRKANNLSRRSMLKVGSRLMIPGAKPQSLDKNSGSKPKSYDPLKVRPNQIAGSNLPTMRRDRKARIHIVRSGENLTVIAEKYQVPVSALKDENRIARGNKLFVGAKLLIPVANAFE